LSGSGQNEKKEFKLRYEELPALDEFVEPGFLLDKVLFAAFSPAYANGFAEKFHNKLKEVQESVSPQVLTEQRKQVTEKLHAAQDAIMVMTWDIKRYCQMAGDKPTFKMIGLILTEFFLMCN
jgi:hypothetical protein